MFSNFGLSASNPNSGSKSAARPVLDEHEEINMRTINSMKEPMKIVSSFITAHHPQVLSTPFEGTDCRFINNQSILLFTSGGGRIAKLNMSDNSIIFDAYVDDKAIWALELPKDEKFVYLGGESNVIKRFDVATFQNSVRYKGHAGEVFFILISPDGKNMYSASADCTVKMWDVEINDHSIDIHVHRGSVQALDISPDGKYIMTGSRDKTACILEYEDSKWRVKGTIFNEAEIYSVKISSKLGFVVTGDDEGGVSAWDFQTLERLRRFKDSMRVWCIDIATSEEFIITAGLSKNVILWDMHKFREKIELKGHTKRIKSIIISKDQKTVITLSEDCKVIRWRIPKFEERHVISAQCTVKTLWFSDANALLYSYLYNRDNNLHMIDAWNLINYTKVKEISLSEANIRHYQRSKDDKLFYIIHKIKYNQFLTAYDLISCEKIFDHDLGALEVSCFEVSKDQKYLFIGQTFKIQTYLLQQDYKIINSQIYHNSKIMQICCTPSNKFIVSFDNARSIKLIDVELMYNDDVRNDLEDLSMFKESGEDIEEIKVMNDMSFIAVSKEMVLFWSIERRAVIKLEPRKNFFGVEYSLDNQFIILRSGSKIEFWTSANYSYNSFIQYAENIESFCISPDNIFIALSRGTEIYVSRSHIAAKSIYICGDISRKNEYLNYMSSIIDDSSEKFNGDFDDWIIEPFHINSLHFYAYYNFDEYLALAIRKGAPFFRTAHGHSPLSICLELNYPRCLNAIIKEIKNIFDSNNFIYLTIENSLAALNKSKYNKLHSLYENLFCTTKNLSLPKFCENQPRFPISVVSDSFIIDKESFARDVMYSIEGNSICFSKSYVKIPILAGTTESIEFLESIDGCKDLKIFGTQFIQVLLKQKWNQVKWIAYFQSLAFATYLTLLSLYTVSYRNPEFLVAPFVMNCYFAIYETSYMISSKGKYFLDPWNYTDILRISSMFFYAILLWAEVYADHEWFLAVVILITWIRGVAYFRVTKPTRYLINLLITACKDILAFLVILFYSTFSFAVIFYSLYPYQTSKGNIDRDFFTYATKFYDLNIGNADTGDYNNLEWFFYVLATIVNPIIMINLLISILGDTYNTVNRNEVVNDARELISLILESELLMFWRRGKGDLKYLHQCDLNESVITGDEASLIKRIKAIKNRLKNLDEGMQKEEKTIMEITIGKMKANTEISSAIEIYEAKRSQKLKA